MEDTKKFWNTILAYSDNPMTYTEADFELSQVYKCIDSNQHEQIKDLFSMGVADGLREPISILDHIEKQGCVLPSRVIVNDISKTLFDQAKTNLVNRGWHNKIDNEIIYFLGKIDEIKTGIVKETKIRLGIIGVYNLGYLKKALHLYQQNADIIGTKFNVYPVYLNNEEDNLFLEHGETITFDITNLSDDIINQIDKNVDQSKHLYAQCVYTTDKHFVSHYFNDIWLKKVISDIFIDYDIDIYQEADNGRYIVVKFQCTKETANGITLMTSLNNVLGNITTDTQIKSLRVLKNLID
ncbi:unnamed protein product [Rotaria sordida]|uniref:Uncharacterized protein n=1 Tax=Rotaria sordida TaxID=392033 RepID=A0A814LDL4_9BILA|nr:unnamed protein product [Rotaria sordida]